MPLWLALLVLAANVGLCLRRYPAGLAVFACLSFLVPHTDIAGAVVSYEILAFLPVLGLYFVRNRPARLDPAFMLLFAYTLMLGLSTLFALLFKNGVLEMASLLGVIRVTILALVISQLLSQHQIRRVFAAVVAVNTVLVAVQILVPDSVGLFHQLYFKDTATSLDAYLELGYIPRSTGSFTSPVALAAFMMITTTLSATRLLRREGGLPDTLMLVCSVFCGLMAASKLYLLGAPVLVTLAVLLLPFLARERPADRFQAIKNLTIYPLFALVAGGGFWLAQRLSAENPFLKYSFDFLFKPGEAFVTRYAADDGALDAMADVIVENVVIGVGKTTLRNEFVGDSAYLLMLHDAGLVGTAVLSTMIAVLIVRGVRQRDLPALMAFLALLVAGVATTMLLSVFGALVMTYVLRAQAGVAPKQGGA